ncbi:hypothetical protein [Liquorilactobacillus satsumensis]|uniref:hypothetical protein n=1 Tax=Liquorilactobacillus satsumensis TaxID=259059 RepID=UPI0039EAF2B4
MLDNQKVIWEVFHNQDLDVAVNKAHRSLPLGYNVKSVDVKKIDSEFIITVIAKWGADDAEL